MPGNRPTRRGSFHSNCALESLGQSARCRIMCFWMPRWAPAQQTELVAAVEASVFQSSSVLCSFSRYRRYWRYLESTVAMGNVAVFPGVSPEAFLKTDWQTRKAWVDQSRRLRRSATWATEPREIHDWGRTLVFNPYHSEHDTPSVWNTFD